jgi:hypothetical protein
MLYSSKLEIYFSKLRTQTTAASNSRNSPLTSFFCNPPKKLKWISIKGLKAEMSTIKKLVKDLQSSNGSKNQASGPSGASKQKQKAQGRKNQSRKPVAQKADDAANDSQPANKKKLTSNSKNRSQSKKKHSNTKNRNQSTQSRNGSS